MWMDMYTSNVIEADFDHWLIIIINMLNSYPFQSLY